MQARRLLSALRAGTPVDPVDLRWFAGALATGRVSDAQAGAFAMAVCLRGLSEAGRVALTEAMRDSGDVLAWDLPGPVLDKHSTGGIGDCVSLVLAPALAACGAWVPMISGRGLGHTGGTLDKLAAIPGLEVTLGPARMREVLDLAGCAIVAASDRLAPSDHRLYAIRDVTGTVESPDLICASILSKKLAAGLGGLVLDVKCGSGAFMPTLPEARALACALVETAIGAGCRARALITAMDQPLAPAAGNALEVVEALAVLRGDAGGRLRTLTEILGGEALALGGLAPTSAVGATRIAAALDSGAAADRFARMVAGQGGPGDLIDRPVLPRAPVVVPLPAPHDGVVCAIDGRALGLAVVALGGGRRVEGDRVDPAVGLSGILPLGTDVTAGAPLLLIHAADDAAARAARDALARAVTVGDGPGVTMPLVGVRVG